MKRLIAQFAVLVALVGVGAESRAEIVGTAGRMTLVADRFLGTFDSVSLPDLPAGLAWERGSLLENGTISVVPEPSTLILLAMGAVGLLAYAWRRRQRRTWAFSSVKRPQSGGSDAAPNLNATRTACGGVLSHGCDGRFARRDRLSKCSTGGDDPSVHRVFTPRLDYKGGTTMVRSIALVVVMVLLAGVGESWAGSVSLSEAIDQRFVTVDFSAYHDTRLQSFEPNGISSRYLEGYVVFGGGPPFDIPIGGLNAWLPGYPDQVSGTLQVDIPVGVYGVSEVYTLINTIWGEAVPGTFASIQFFGSEGAFFEKQLDGNSDVRDWLQSSRTNSINGTTTVNVFTVGSGLHEEIRLDMQTISLPDEFGSEVLDSIRIIDNGGWDFQRLMLSGVTVKAIPEPSTIILLAMGAVGLLAYSRRRRK